MKTETKTEPAIRGTKPEEAKPAPPKTVLETLSELSAQLEQSPDRRALALLALGAALGMAIAAGWHEQELANLRAWPRP